MSLILEYMETEALIRAVYQTLLHSIWQGAAIAAIIGLIILSAGKLSAGRRYNFLAVGMLLFVLTSVVTFFRVANTTSDISSGKESVFVDTNQIHLAASTDMLDQVFSTLSFYSNTIVLVWFIVICFKGLQLSLGLQRISNLKNKQVFDPGKDWTLLFRALSLRMGITTIVRFAESGLTAIPLTVGYLKPVILVPVGMLVAIPAEQVEAIILHELAHIKRQDYFINIFQTLVEVLFFFNPAIWWLSNRLRVERENCCDDLAIASSSSKTEYVRALITFEEYRTQHPQLSIAFAGSENSLLKRTKRIIYNQNDTLNPMEKFILTSGLVVSGLLSLAFTDGAKEQISKTLKPVVSTISNALPAVKSFTLFPDTIPASNIHEISINGGSTTFNADHKGKSYKIVMQDDQVTELYVNNTKIAKEKLGDYTNTIIEIVQFNDVVKTSENSDNKSARGVFTAFESPKTALSFGGEPLKVTGKLTLDNGLSEVKFAALADMSATAGFSAIADTVPPAIPAAPAAPSTPPVSPATAPTPPLPETPAVPHVAPRAQVKAIKAIKAMPAKAPKARAAPAIEFRATPDVKPILHITPKVTPAIEIQETPVLEKIKPAATRGSSMGYAPKLMGRGSNSYSPNTNLNRKITSNDFAYQVNKELLTEGLVKDEKKFSYKINNDELIVDGVKQSAELHNRVISKVLKNKNQNIDFTYKKN